VDVTGPPHRRIFVSAALVGGVELGRGSGTSKKVAEQAAALIALDVLRAGPGLAAPPGTEPSCT